MSKKISLLFILLSCFFVVEGQKLVRFGLNFGLDAAVNKKSLGENFTVDKSTGFEVGAYVRVGSRFFGQAGGGYCINKMHLTRDTVSSAIDLGQINIPLWGGLNIKTGKNTFFRCMLGVQYRNIVHVSNNGVDVTRSDFNRNNMDVIIGVGMDIAVFTLDVSFRKAILPLIPHAQHYQDVINVSIGFLF